MKKIFVFLLAVCVLSVSLLPAVASADVLIEVDDSFWEKNRDKCEYFYRRYTVNGPEGYAALWESPGSSRQEEVLANGTELWSTWHYTDGSGEIWCAIPADEASENGYKVRGWIRTSDCLAVPDNISFKEAHGTEFEKYDSSYDHVFDELDEVVLWTYPCSGITAAEQIDADWFKEKRDFDVCWRDPQGRMWAFVGYCYGIRQTWICLDDPANNALGIDEEVLPQEAAVYPPADKLPSPDNGVTGLAIAAVLAVVAVTAILLWFFFEKKRSES